MARPIAVALDGVEVNVTDPQPESSDGQPIRTMVLDFAPDDGWNAIGPMPSASWLHPVLARMRQDKRPGLVDTRFARVLERCMVSDAASATPEVARPPSEIVRRKVWTRAAKGKVTVRKLVAWKTHKPEFDPSYPACVVHWTDLVPEKWTPRGMVVPA